MQIRMTNLEQLSLGEMEELLSSSRKVTWEAKDVAAKYAIIAAVLKAQSYRKLSKRERGIVRRFLARVTATSRAQLTRLIGRWMEERKIVRRPAQRPRFTSRYLREDIVLLAATGRARGSSYRRCAGSGANSRSSAGRSTNGCRRSRSRIFTISGAGRLTKISASECSPAKPADRHRRRGANPIRSAGRDTCAWTPQHQGQKDGKAGVFHIQCRRPGDAMADHRMRGDDQRAGVISLPVLEAMLHQFPFRILGFHCDNGSEFLNHRVAAMLEKLRWNLPSPAPIARPTTRWWMWQEWRSGSQARRLRWFYRVEHAETI